jgi:BCCT family betaine/carnitine transporter
LKQRIDKTWFIATIAVILLMTVPLVIAPKFSADVMQQVYEYVTNNFGFLYTFLASAILILLMWIAFDKYGAAKLVDIDDEPILASAAIMHERNKCSDELYTPKRMLLIICLMELV